MTDELEKFLADLEAVSEKATPEWRAHERGYGINREFEIELPRGGILFRSTSYGNMKQDAEFIGMAHPNTVKKLVAIIRAQAEALEQTSRILDGIQSECEASVYTLTDDEFEKVYFARDIADEAQEKVKKIVGIGPDER